MLDSIIPRGYKILRDAFVDGTRASSCRAAVAMPDWELASLSPPPSSFSSSSSSSSSSFSQDTMERRGIEPVK